MSRGSQMLATTSNGQPETAAGSNSRPTQSLNDIWKDLSDGIDSIYQQQTMSKARYMILYS